MVKAAVRLVDYSMACGNWENKHGFNYSHSSDGTGLHRCRLADADGFRKDANEKNYKNIKGASRKNEDLKK